MLRKLRKPAPRVHTLGYRMPPSGLRIGAILLALVGPTLSSAGEHVHHDLTVELDPTAKTLWVTDRITLPDGMEAPFEFLLHAALKITDSSTPISRVELGDVKPFFGNNSGAEIDVELARYRVEDSAAGPLSITYGGVFYFGLGDQKEEYSRGFRQTTGIVGEEGVYLSGGSFWIPRFDDGLLSFEADIGIPEDWHVISQGNGISRGENGRARWSSGGPMDEAYFVGGPLEIYRDQAGAVETLVYLRDEDDGLAGKYLATTAQYLEMYRELLGPYPYDKFALVENFWETGYGMPSFTLLGPKVIRFPFILHSSYPHEILHNWWGNSVFVDYESGNWCEGLTAYLADHLIKEQRGQGALYRRDALQRYRSYVQEGDDFPLIDFRSRHSGASEAIGYGKTMMGFHMLRRSLGDDAFVAALRDVYRKHRGRKASFDDLRQSFAKAASDDLDRFFSDWTTRPGAARLVMKIDSVSRRDEGYRVIGRIAQTQEAEPFLLDVPMALQTEAGLETSTVRLDGRATTFQLKATSHPQALYVDPDFDLFRLLDPREIPPSIGQIFGEPQILALLPADASDDDQQKYRELMSAWNHQGHAIEVRTDAEVEALPTDRAVWVLGHENRFVAEHFTSDPTLGLDVGDDGLSMQEQEIPFDDHSLVVIRRHPSDLSRAIGWLAVRPGAAFPGMARKLPHYGKYSYLGFEGDEPTNVVKGQWPTADSPLRVDLRSDRMRTYALSTPQPEVRDALAELPPVFSQKPLAEHVAFLASAERGGRSPGSEGLRQSADFVAEQFAAAGLEPVGDDGGWFQEVTVQDPDGQTIQVRNVLGVLRSNTPERASESVILSAHLDHLGTGWPDVHQGNEGKLHPGADDNASGVAILIELAKNFAAGDAPIRNLVFAAFTAEEAGRLGSRHYVEHPAFPLDQLIGVINLDAVGRLGDRPLSVLGTGTANEWQHIFRGVSFVTGVESRNVPGNAEGSDQWSFIERGVPGVQIFSGTHDDYHRPSDTVDKIDTAGLVKVATFVKESVAYLAYERKEPMTPTIAGSQNAPPRTGGGRRVSFGSVPDFGFAGPGVKLSGVTPGSPAESAGLQEGDVLLSIDGREIADLRAFSEVLKTLEPGQTVAVVFTRGGEGQSADVTVKTR